MNLKWDTNVNEVEGIYNKILPKFKEVGKKAGLFKNDKSSSNESIPNFGGKPYESSKDGSMATPPWKQKDIKEETNNTSFKSN